MMLSEKKTFEAYASKRVSFIMMTKNRAEYLRKALKLHRNLIGPDDELIIIDGLSSDGTAEIVAKYRDAVDVFVSEPDVGANHAFNKGILIARGKYIKHLSDDDEFYSEGMEQAVKVLEEYPKIGLLVCGGIRTMDGKISPYLFPPGVDYGKNPEDVFKYGASGVGFVYRRSSLAKIGLIHPTDFDADQEIILRAISRGANVKFCRINLFYHPIISHSVTASHRRAWEKDRNRLLRQYCSIWFYCWYRWLRPLRWYYVSRWFNRSLLAGFFKIPGTLRVARALRRSVKSTPDLTQAVGERKPGRQASNIWDGGFS